MKKQFKKQFKLESVLTSNEQINQLIECVTGECAEIDVLEHCLHHVTLHIFDGEFVAGAFGEVGPEERLEVARPEAEYEYRPQRLHLER